MVRDVLSGNINIALSRITGRARGKTYDKRVEKGTIFIPRIRYGAVEGRARAVIDDASHAAQRFTAGRIKNVNLVLNVQARIFLIWTEDIKLVYNSLIDRLRNSGQDSIVSRPAYR